MNRPLSKEKNKKVIGVIKDNLGGKLLKEFIGLRAKTFKEKKVKGTKKCAIKRKLKFKEYKNCLEATQLENQINHPEKN